jgi:hypothetical protein
MATYAPLAHFTERGIMNVKNTAQREEEFKLMAIRHGAAVRETFWTLGQYDIVAIVEAPDEMTMTALGPQPRRARLCAHANTPRILGNGDADHPAQDGLTASLWTFARRG